MNATLSNGKTRDKAKVAPLSMINQETVPPAPIFPPSRHRVAYGPPCATNISHIADTTGNAFGRPAALQRIPPGSQIDVVLPHGHRTSHERDSFSIDAAQPGGRMAMKNFWMELILTQ